MAKTSSTSISRREFARRVAIASAATAVPATGLLPQAVSADPWPQQPPNTPALAADSQAEAEARYQTILNLYGSRFSEAQKTDLRRLCFSAQPSLDRLRAHAVNNSDDPALYLKPLVEREKTTHVAPPIHSTKEAPKNP